MLHDRAERQRREEGQAPTTSTGGRQQAYKEGPWVGNVPLEDGTFFCAARLPATARRGTMNMNGQTAWPAQW